MNRAIFATILCCFVFFTIAQGAVNFPYPQESNYENGAIVTTSGASAALKAKFTSFFGSHYENSSDNTLGRIKFDNLQQTVSEGIGYGMIMMVYFSDASRSYQAEFDRLWAYYNKFLDQRGLMHWQINGFTGVAGQNAATDAEFDVAFALEMAYYQFGGQKYLDDAKALVEKIKQHEMETDGLHKPGDGWGANVTRRNPSYVSPAAFELFKRVDNSFWTTALTRNYTLLKANQNQTTGLPSDWCNNSGTPESNNFGYDASRAPWRWAWSYAWFGHQDAKSMLDKLAAWVKTKNVTDIRGSINITNGNGGSDNNSTFIGPLLNSMQVSKDYQSNINTYWTALIAKNEDSYFNKSMQLLTGLFATGNMPNLKALSDKPSSSSVAPSSSSSAPSSSSYSSSSSVSSSSSFSSSSSSSSSSNGETPIVLPQPVNANALSPMNNRINLQVMDNASIQIFDLKGNVVRTLRFEPGNYVVQLADLPRGLYVLRAISASWRQTAKIMVK